MGHSAVAHSALSNIEAGRSQTGYNWFENTSLYSSPNSMDSPTFSLPELGSGGGRFIEVNKHKALGEWSLQRLGKSAPLVNDPWSQEQLESMAWKINAQARNQAPLALMVINNASINAFAIPGGVMGIHTGTVIESNSIDEVASVIAFANGGAFKSVIIEHRDEASRKHCFDANWCAHWQRCRFSSRW